MSFDFRTIQRPSNDPILAFIAELQKQAGLKLAQDQVGALDDSEDIYSDSNDVESKISLNVLLHEHVFRFNKEYISPIDPGRMVTYWIRGYNIGSYMRDFSAFKHPSLLYGEPLIVDGTIDLGIYDESADLKSKAVRFNRPTSPFINEEYSQIPDHSDLHIDSLIGGQGFSVFFRFRLKSLAQQGGLSRTIVEKIDDNTPNYGYLIKVNSSGKIQPVVAWNGTEQRKETAAGVVVADKTYSGFLTFGVTGTPIELYTREEEEPGQSPNTTVHHTLTNSADSAGWHSTKSNHDVNIFRRGLGSAGGYTYGDLYDIEFYRPYGSFTGIVSEAQAENRFENKWSISDIPFGQVMITNHWATSFFDVIGLLSSFTGTSFTSTSFNT